MPRRVRFGFDDHHPVGGSHHQKVVVVDDQLAFCGGIDLTGHRWDTSAHRLEEPARTTPLGKAYGPYHEIQAMVTGPAAAKLGVLARDRWRALQAERLPPLGTPPDDLWPSDFRPDLTDVNVAIVRTVPGSNTQPAIRECEALFLDSISQAQRAIYIESQYFTNDRLAHALAARLREPRGPEIIVVAPKECHGWLERATMGAFRDSVFRELIAADAHGRLRLVYPAASRAQAVPTFIHSKVMIVDDRLARIGSANYSRRSMGVDTECDLAVEASRATERSGIRQIRDRLLAEHLGVPVEHVAREIERTGALGALIDRHSGADHTLVRIELPEEQAALPSPALRAAADPDEPIGAGSSVDQVLPVADATSGRSPLRVWILPLVILGAAAAVASTSLASIGRSELQNLQHAVESIPSASASGWLGIGLFLLAGLLLVPLELLAIAAGLLFGAVRGGLVALIGSFGAAVIGYAAGRLMGSAKLSRWMTRRSYRSGRQLSGRGILGVVVLRLSSVASAGAIHLLCGARKVPFGTYIAGTALGVTPAVALLSGLGALLRRTLLHPSVSNGLIAIGAGLVLIALAAALRTFLLIRQFAPMVTSHRERAEFG
jgi:uncharacterized membrane protein YdjX (TVP38/TMEM64 family)